MPLDPADIDSPKAKFANLQKFCKIPHTANINTSLPESKCKPSLTGQAIGIFYQKEQLTLAEEVNFLRWIGFIESELRHYNSGSKCYCCTLNHLEYCFQTSDFLSGKDVNAEDIFLASYLEERGLDKSKYPLISRWIQRSLDGYITPQSNQRKLTENKTTASGKKSKGDHTASGRRSKPVKDDQKIMPLKILCLHGYRQSGPSFRAKLGSFRKIAGKFAELTFITAPKKISEEEYGWWFSSNENSFDAHQVSDCDEGFAESIDFISETFRKEGPFQGILSFSQGASLGASLCVLQELGKLQFSFEFSIIVAGFISRNVRHQEIFKSLKDSKGTVSTPALHVFGSADKVIEQEMSEELLEYFGEADVSKHDGGHFLPTSGQTKQDLVQFLQKMQAKDK